MDKAKVKKSIALLVALVMVTSLFAGYTLADENDDAVTRLAGDDRWETSQILGEFAVDEGYVDGDKIILARGDYREDSDDDEQFPDALAASFLAGVLDAPILLTDKDELPEKIEDAIEEIDPDKAYILGGEMAVSENVEDEVEALLNNNGNNNNDLIKRLEGDDRFETAVEIAIYAEDEHDADFDKAYVVNGFRPADSMVAGAKAFKDGVPILLIREDEVPDDTSDAIDDFGIETLVIVGGTAVVEEDLKDDLEAIGNVDNVYRRSGDTREKTSADFAEEEFADYPMFSVVGWHGLPDAVGASVFGAPIIYTHHDGELGDEGEDFIDDKITRDTEFLLFGGENVVDDGMDAKLKDKLDELELTVESVEATSKEAVEVAFSLAVDEDDRYGADKFLHYADPDDLPGVGDEKDDLDEDNYTLGDEVTWNDEKVEVKFAEEVNDLNKEHGLAILDDDDEVEFVYEGIFMPYLVFESAAMCEEDLDVLVATFSEDLDENEAENENNYTVKDPTEDLDPVTNTIVDASFAEENDEAIESVVELTFDADKVEAGKTYRLELNRDIVAANGAEMELGYSNIYEDFDTPAIEDVKPALEEADIIAKDKIEITFKREISSDQEPSEIWMAEHEEDLATSTVDNVTFADKKVTIELEEEKFEDGKNYDIEIKPEAFADNIYRNAESDKIELTLTTTEDAAPEYVEAKFMYVDTNNNGERMTSFDEPVEEGNVRIDLVIEFDRTLDDSEPGVEDGDIRLVDHEWPNEYEVDFSGDATTTIDNDKLIVEDVEAGFFDGLDFKERFKAEGEWEIRIEEGVVKSKEFAQMSLTLLNNNFENEKIEDENFNAIDAFAPQIEVATLCEDGNLEVEFDRELLESEEFTAWDAESVTLKGYKKLMDGHDPYVGTFNELAINDRDIDSDSDSFSVTPLVGKKLFTAFDNNYTLAELLEVEKENVVNESNMIYADSNHDLTDAKTLTDDFEVRIVEIRSEDELDNFLDRGQLPEGKLMNEITVSAAVIVKNNQTLDLQEYTLDFDEYSLQIKEGVDEWFRLTGVAGEGKLTANDDENMAAFDESPLFIRVWNNVEGDVTIENVVIDLENVDDTAGSNFYAIGVQSGIDEEVEVGVHDVEIKMKDNDGSHGILYQGGTVNVTNSKFETDSTYSRGIIISEDQGFDGNVKDISGNDFTGIDYSGNGRGITFDSGGAYMEEEHDSLPQTIEYILTENTFAEDAIAHDEEEGRVKFAYGDFDGFSSESTTTDVTSTVAGEVSATVNLDASDVDKEKFNGLTATAVFELIDDDDNVMEADSVEPVDGEDGQYEVEWSGVAEADEEVKIRVLDVEIDSPSVDTTGS